jgi:hypothetical protein
MSDRYVYIAISSDHDGLVKVGCSASPSKRMAALKSEYGVEFVLIHKEFFKDAASIEATCHSLLSPLLYQGLLGEKRNVGHEIFKCSVDLAKSALAIAALNPHIHEKLVSTRKINLSSKTRISDTRGGQRFIINRNGVEVFKLEGLLTNRPILLDVKTGDQVSYHGCTEVTIVDTGKGYIEARESKVLSKIKGSFPEDK